MAKDSGGGLSGNSFHGSTAAQHGEHSVQINHYGPPPGNPRNRLRITLAALAVLVLLGGALTLALWKYRDGTADPDPEGRSTHTPSGAAPAPGATRESGTPSPDASGATGASDAPAPEASLTSDPGGIQWTGPVRIAEDGPYLDEKPPKIKASTYGEDVDLGLVDPPRLSGRTGESNLALWPGTGMPTRQECADLIATQGVRQVKVAKGTVVCVATQEGRTAVLTITSTSNNFTDGVMAQATVWSTVTD